MDDEQIERLGIYFVYNNIRSKWGLTFERFVELNVSGAWKKHFEGRWEG